ncbi:serine hydrolase domain-containing protein [Enterococcus sp. AZ196]|uniref:serine hydrolase domain-containing protein n=1 Tax=Enterococcus sp. AZ196 TaxID=2774659 RepID=UPI003D2C22BA
MRRSKISGLSAAQIDVVNKDFYLGVMGKVPPFATIPVAAGMLYDLASLTKVLGTTTRILQMIDSGLLNLQIECREVLPEFPRLRMTIEDLLLHRSELPSDFKEKQLFTEETMYSFLKDFTPYKTNETIYSDIGYLLLGLVIEQIDDQNLENTFKRHIFEPLGMKNTTYYPDFQQFILPTEITTSRGIILGTVHDSKANRWSRPAGSAGLFAPLEDIIRFTQGVMLNKKMDGSQLFSTDIYQKLRDVSISNRTLGWEKSFGEGIIYHTGFTGTSMGIDLVKQRGLILLTNRVHPSRENTDYLTYRHKLYQDFFKGA